MFYVILRIFCKVFFPINPVIHLWLVPYSSIPLVLLQLSLLAQYYIFRFICINFAKIESKTL